MKKPIKVLIIAIIIIACMASAMTILSTPPVKGGSAPEKEFSAVRAMSYVNAIAKVPHPTGSSENIEVRDYIVEQLKELGLNPEVQKTYVKLNLEKFNTTSESNVENIVAKIDGTEGKGKSILLTAHYDSTNGGPGAADDTSGVAAILETIRAIKADKPLKNDLIILISDGEEMMMLGAAGFAREHPYMKDVGLVMNLEARGNSGPSLMFETGDENEPYMRAFSKAVDYPVSFSLLYEMYKRMPNGTDFTIYKDMGISGFNFAYIGSPETYHSMEDTPANLSLGSLQHQGDYILSLARYLGNINLESLKGNNTNSVYFTVFRGVFAEYSYKLVIPLTLITLILFIGTLIIAIKRRKVTVKGLGKGIVAAMASVISVILTVFVLWWLFKTLILHTNNMNMFEKYNVLRNPLLNNIGFGTFAVIASILLFMSSKICKRWVNGLESLFSGMVLWAVFMIISTFSIQGLSYLFTWPLMFASIAALTILLLENEKYREIKYIIGLLLTCLPAFTIFVPIVYLMLLGLLIDAAPIIIFVFTIPAIVVIPFIYMYLNYEQTINMNKSADAAGEL